MTRLSVTMVRRSARVVAAPEPLAEYAPTDVVWCVARAALAALFALACRWFALGG